MRNRTARAVVISAVASLAIAGSAQASHGADDPVGHGNGRDDGALHMRHGADDPAGHDATDDRRARKAARHHRHAHRHHHRHGADDGPNHR